MLQTFGWISRRTTKTSRWRNPHTYLLQRSWMHIFAYDCCKWLKERFFFTDRAIRIGWYLSPCFTSWCLTYSRKFNELVEGSATTDRAEMSRHGLWSQAHAQCKSFPLRAHTGVLFFCVTKSLPFGCCMDKLIGRRSQALNSLAGTFHIF